MFVYNDGHVNSNGIRIGLTFNHTIIMVDTLIIIESQCILQVLEVKMEIL